MHTAWPARLAWLGALLGLAIALLLFAPARWLAHAITSATGGQLQLVNERGTVWRGQADVLLTGGQLRKQSLSLQGSQAEASLNTYSFDTLFLGVDGLDLQFGLTTHHEAEASLNHRKFANLDLCRIDAGS